MVGLSGATPQNVVLVVLYLPVPLKRLDDRRLEGGLVRVRARRAGGQGRDVGDVEVLRHVGVALLEERVLRLGVGDRVAPPLVHVLVRERLRGDLEPPTKTIFVCISSSKEADGAATTMPFALNWNGPLTCAPGSA